MKCTVTGAITEPVTALLVLRSMAFKKKQLEYRTKSQDNVTELGGAGGVGLASSMFECSFVSPKLLSRINSAPVPPALVWGHKKRLI